MTSQSHGHEARLCAIAGNPIPPNARVGTFQTSDGVRLRYAVFGRTAAPHRGTVCLVQGRGEFIEKYFETITDFQKRGFAVAAYDLRGQGGSERLIPNPRLGYVEHFSDYWTDLESFHRSVLLPDCPPPYYLVGHSTGGLIALLAATRDRLMFDRVFAASPMLSLPGLPFGLAGTRRVLNAARFLGLARMPLGRKADAVPGPHTFEGNPLTADRARYLRQVEIAAADPTLQVGAPTVGWVAAALEGMTQANADAFPQRLLVPVFMVAGARDAVVSTAATESLGVRLRNGHHMVIGGARHEMFMEVDAVRAQVFAAFDAFVTDQTE